MALLPRMLILFVLCQVFWTVQSVLTNVTCHADFMEAIFDKNALKGSTPYLTDNNPQCEYSVNTTDDSVIVKIPFYTCGTETDLAEDYISFFNKVNIRHDKTGPIIRAEDVYPVGCVYGPTTGLVTRSNHPYYAEELRLRVYTNTSYTFRLDLYKSEKFENNVALPYTPKLKARVHFELAVYETEGDISLAVTECVATPRDNIDDDLRYALIRDSCLLDSTMREYAQPEPWIRRYSFQSFVFRRQPPVVFLHCYLRVCAGPEMDKCLEGCTKPGARRRRAADEEGTTVTFGPILVASAGERHAGDSHYGHDEKPLYLTVIGIFAGAALLACGIIIGAVVYKKRQIPYVQAQNNECL